MLLENIQKLEKYVANISKNNGKVMISLIIFFWILHKHLTIKLSLKTCFLLLDSKLVSYVWYWYFFSRDSIETLPSHKHFQFRIAMFKE